MFVIVMWDNIESVGLMLDEAGQAMLFEDTTEEKVEQWAEENCAFNYKVMEIW